MALRIWSVRFVKWPGECGIKIALLLDDAPISSSMSKYCVIRTRFMTSLAVVPGTERWNSSTETRAWGRARRPRDRRLEAAASMLRMGARRRVRRARGVAWGAQHEERGKAA